MIESTEVQTDRLNTHVRRAGDPAAPAVVLVHGNVSSGVFFEELMEQLASDYHVIAPDFRGFGRSERKTIDATRGMGDFADDLHALVEALDLGGRLHLLGWSVGGGVVMRYAIDHPDRVASLVLESPMSPYGFGGTKDEKGTPVWDDFAGSGGGTANPDFVRLLAENNRGDDNPASPLNTMRAFYFKQGFALDPETEGRYLDGMLEMAVGDDVYPGDMTASDNWPGAAPGSTGMNNAISPKYLNLSGFAKMASAPPVLWIRGDSDQIVSDTSFLDFGYLGQLGMVPDWPGADVYPPQPMVSQMRAVLERAGDFEEVVYEDCGHSPHIEKPEEFVRDLRRFWP